MVSTKTNRVAGVSAASTARASVASTNATPRPCVASVANMLLVLPKRNALETM